MDIRGALIRGIIIDDHRNIVDMSVNTVSAQNADALGEREHANIDGGE